ncbi:uncharacterized protein LY89DRAFT_787818 [Mollisia scopiformis]|uniref:F-box domain-containing protein n=1 Tax=Mollisia scopiformis TaxID=149040 RepID=A0A132BDX5_MOLSC|nr:uncharacterized protein LY89DRAFT_787818 [Mollisia scopiformis]KUJ10199.1 hypothetical protein LY89DRAFT_787818 [Mollisia scopiformis]
MLLLPKVSFGSITLTYIVINLYSHIFPISFPTSAFSSLFVMQAALPLHHLSKPSHAMETLPIEIKLEILRHALHSSVPLAFCPLPLSRSESRREFAKYPTQTYLRQRYSSTLRLALWNQCLINEPVTKQFMETFSVLSLVSKSTRESTRKIFFGENKWVLHITRTFNAISWIEKYWGVEVLGLMRDVRIEAQALRKACFNALDVFTTAAAPGGRLNSLEVQWLEKTRPLQTAMRKARGENDETWHFHPMLRDHGLERNSEGGRGLIIQPGEEHEYDEDDLGTKYEGVNSEPEEWQENEVVLVPLGKLRGVRKVRIEGTVREKWATWLEGVMMSKPEEDVEEFPLSAAGRRILGLLEDADGLLLLQN